MAWTGDMSEGQGLFGLVVRELESAELVWVRSQDGLARSSGVAGGAGLTTAGAELWDV